MDRRELLAQDKAERVQLVVRLHEWRVSLEAAPCGGRDGLIFGPPVGVGEACQ